jgi:hypothetical protein
MTNNVKSETPLSRQEETISKKRSQRSRKKETQPKGKFKIYQTRLIPIWLRIVIVLALAIIACTVGLMIGYGVIGDGKAMDALKWETYQHILDLIKGVE